MLFRYQILTKEGEAKKGSIDALNEDMAVRALQQRGFTIISIEGEEKKTSFFGQEFSLTKKVPVRELVILSKQIATLFSARVSALKSFRMLSEEAENPILRKTLAQVTEDVQGGAAIADAMEKHPLIFSNFYTNMVRSGEETGKLNEVFNYLAEYLRRSYELMIKARNAFIYPVFVIGVFIIVMVLLLTVVYPQLSAILLEVGQEIPLYTRVIIALSNFLIDYGVLLLVFLVIGGISFWRFAKTDEGKMYVSRAKLNFPLFGGLARKFYLSRISDNMHTMLTSGITLAKTLEITATVVNDARYERILREAVEDVKGGILVSETFGKHEEIPGIMIQIIRAGEETGELGTILETLADFYRREVYNAVDGLVGLIEPILIVALGGAVGIVIASVLIPIYNISTGF